ncbi:MAG: exo-alpha-sialidase [Clostridia bacterium]|nr:exo-alpha-sialidase [Clostridia bacterium]
MSIRINGENGVVCRVPDSMFGYFGWPSIARMDDGTLAVAVSGLRNRHICPWGKDTISFSHDGGGTWTQPVVAHDSPLDDRDAGLVYLGAKTLLLTWFTLDPRQFHELFRRDMTGAARAWMEAKLSAITDDTARANAGSWTRISFDGGETWSAPRPSPVTAPHGPIQLKNNTLMYAGKPFPPGDKRPMSQDVAVALSIDLGMTWKVIASVPCPPGFAAEQVHEPHLVELGDGTLLCALRVHEKDTAAVWMSRSTDRGFTWSEPYRLPCDGTPPHLLMHSSGRVVCVYGYRHEPYGQRALVSRDGLNWGEELILRDDGLDGDLGYPASVELEDGSIYTIYYQRLPGDSQTSVLSTRWTLPEE